MTDEPDDVARDAFEERALRALAAAERLAPPTELAARVMQSVRERATHDVRPAGRARILGDRNPEFWLLGGRGQPSGVGTTSSRKLLLGIAAAAVLAIALFSVKGVPPVGTGTEATAGAARKHTSSPIAAKDVSQPNTEIQRALQGESLRKLLSDPETLALLSSKDFQKAMTASEVQAFIAQAARDPSVAQALDGVLGKAFQDGGLQKRLADASHDPAVTDLLANTAFQEAMSNSAFTNLLADAAFTKALGDHAFLDAISSAAFLDAAKSGALAAAVDQAVSAAAAPADKATDTAGKASAPGR